MKGFSCYLLTCVTDVATARNSESALNCWNMYFVHSVNDPAGLPIFIYLSMVFLGFPKPSLTVKRSLLAKGGGKIFLFAQNQNHSY
jgi:hypothetical protein